MLTPAILTYRKWRSSNLFDTMAAAWEEVYRKRVLNPYVANEVWDRSGLCIGTRSNFDDGFESDATPEIYVPKKAWIGQREFMEIEKHAINDPGVYSVANCVVFRPNGLAITADGKTVADTISPPELLKKRHTIAISKLIFENGIRYGLRELKEQNIRKRSELEKEGLERVCPLLPLWPNYYHWTVECLPRLRGIERWYQQTGNQTTLLIPPDPPSWMVESIEILASKSYKAREFTEASHTVQELIVPTYPSPSPISCEWLRKKSVAGIVHSKPTASRIYISREKANRRRVANQGEIEDVLSQFGFESYVLEEMSIRDQVRLFMNAEAVVSPHGAGLANIVYADNPVIIELFGSEKKTTFYRLAKLLNHEYYHISGQSRFADIVIDPAELSTTLQTALE